MVYDTDGYFDAENIKPNSIDTNMLTVGSKSQQFILVDVVLEANVSGLPNRFDATAGNLVHLTIDEKQARVWNMAAASVTLAESNGYYVFAKCSKGGSSGVFYITQQQLKVENVEDPNNYYFQVGIIGSLHTDDNFRDFVSTYGFTRVNGNTITTGKIITSDGECYLDLDGNTFRIGDVNSSLSWAKGKLILKGTLIQNQAGDTSELAVYRGTYNATYVYYRGDEVNYTNGSETCTYRYVNPTPGKGKNPLDSVYWAIMAKGEHGTDGLSVFLAYHASETEPAAPTGNGTTQGWHTKPDPLDIWMSQKVAENASVGEWGVPIKMKGEPGKDGTDGISGSAGEYYEYRYAVNGSTTVPPALNNTAAEPDGWSKTMPTVGTLKYLWCTIAKKSSLVDDTLAYLPVNASDTTAIADKSGNGYNASLSKGAAIENDGSRGYVLDLNGSGESQIPLDLPWGKSFTICTYVKTDRNTLSWMLNCYNGREFIEQSVDMVANTWAHFAFRFNERTITVFKNGTQMYTGGTKEVHVGFSMYDDNMFGTNACFDEIRVFKSALSAADVNKVITGAADKLIQNWSIPIRVNPYDGKDGSNGIDGAKGEKGDSPVLVFRGVYDGSKTYYGTSVRLDAVKFNGVYYIARIDAGTFSGKAPTDTSKWNTFGAQFETIATNLLLAEGANIGDWFMSGGKITSTLSDGNKITLDASMARILVESSKNGDWSITGGGCRIEINANNGTVEARSKDSYDVAYLSSSGVFCNKSDTNAMPASSGYTHRGAIVGLGYANVPKNEWSIDSEDTIVAGVYGRASNSGTAPAYGGFFYDLYAAGLTFRRKAITSTSGTTYLSSGDTMIVGYTSNNPQNVYLPTATKEGTVIFVKQWWNGVMRFYPRGGQLIYDDTTSNDYYDFGEGWAGMFVFTIGYVNGAKKEAWLVSRFRY